MGKRHLKNINVQNKYLKVYPTSSVSVLSSDSQKANQHLA